MSESSLDQKAIAIATIALMLGVLFNLPLPASAQSSSSLAWSTTLGGTPFPGDGYIRDVRISDDGADIAALSDDAKVAFYSKDSSKPLWTYSLSAKGSSLDMSSDGKYLVASNDKDKVVLFQNNSSVPVWTFYAKEGVNSVSISSDGSIIAAASDDNTLYVFNNRSSKPIWSFSGTEDMYLVKVSPDGKSILVSSDDKNVYLFGSASNTYLWKKSVEATCYSAAFSPDLKTVAVGTWYSSSKLFVLDRASGYERWSKEIDYDPGTKMNGVTALSYSSDSQFLSVTGMFSHAYVFHLASKTMVMIYDTGSSNTIADNQLLSNGKYLALGTTEKDVRLIKRSTGELVYKYTTTAFVGALRCSGDMRYLIAGTDDNKLLFFKLSLPADKRMFDPSVDGYKIQNWGDAPYGNITQSEVSTALATDPDTPVRSDWFYWLEYMFLKNLTFGGHCYGMTDEAVQYYNGSISRPSGKSTTYGLTQDEAQSDIESAQAKAGLNAKFMLTYYAAKWKAIDATHERNALLGRLDDKDPVPLTLGYSNKDGSKTMIAYNYTYNSDGAVVLSVYDPDYPGVAKTLTLEVTAENRLGPKGGYDKGYDLLYINDWMDTTTVQMMNLAFQGAWVLRLEGPGDIRVYDSNSNPVTPDLYFTDGQRSLAMFRTYQVDKYRVEVVGTGAGPYTLYSDLQPTGSVTFQTLQAKGSVKSGKVKVYYVDMTNGHYSLKPEPTSGGGASSLGIVIGILAAMVVMAIIIVVILVLMKKKSKAPVPPGPYPAQVQQQAPYGQYQPQYTQWVQQFPQANQQPVGPVPEQYPGYYQGQVPPAQNNQELIAPSGPYTAPPAPDPMYGGQVQPPANPPRNDGNH